jgi:hypothetical protein
MLYNPIRAGEHQPEWPCPLQEPDDAVVDGKTAGTASGSISEPPKTISGRSPVAACGGRRLLTGFDRSSEDISLKISGIEQNGKGLPIPLQRYLKLNARFMREEGIRILFGDADTAGGARHLADDPAPLAEVRNG